MHKFMRWFCKAIISGSIAIVIASVICTFYYNPGTHIDNKSGETDYVWLGNYNTMTMIEGIAWNRTDKNGFYNASDSLDKNMDILIMGSSNTEGNHILYEQNFPYILSKNTGKSVYNIGMSGHTLLVCINNLKKALENMKPTEYLIIETSSVKYTEDEINKCLCGQMENLQSYGEGLLFYLQKSPYLKLLYAQIQNWNSNSNNGYVIQSEQPDDEQIPEEPYLKLMKYVSDTCSEYGVKPIILYYPNIVLNPDGTASSVINRAALKVFENACQINGILFVNMEEKFMDRYNKDSILPTGFCNTAVGYGHLNKYGTEMIADELTAVILQNSIPEEEK